ncbi:probable disease resistance protein At5g43740 [Hordeum vulgare subsp. vulgare]|uniref:probable disease resistance protein At5g43740 n=1 Tax=Hordeum vulgare subsp. vulgare TaxID=112509 RepID=UPI001D1A59F9|nr:probable disease resistance protein At5g43740 [Hordeum vulgare subsp. vulgare]XP_044974220.1 probable disease resistance protein At5g43740 [Hordeum vulgare subsp. vulgare]
MYGMIPEVARDVLANTFGSIFGIYGHTLVVIFYYRYVVEDLAVAVAKLCLMQMAIRHLDLLPCSEQCIYWLKSVDELQHNEGDIGVAYALCDLNYLGKKARQLLNKANSLLIQGDSLLHPEDNLQGTMNFYMKKVIGFIKNTGDDSDGLLGIWGMGGVGKSSLLKLISDSRSEDDHHSLEVMFVHAGIGCTVSQVQEAIATSMGLSITHNETSQANIIRDHLTDTSFLLLLDELWEYLDLGVVGIPFPLGRVVVSLPSGSAHKKWRKVVLTTRNMYLCHKMKCRRENIIRMECFNEEKAWELYREGWPAIINRDDEIDILLPQKENLSPRSDAKRQVLQLQRRTIFPDQPQYLEDDELPEINCSEKVGCFIEANDTQSLLMGIWGMRGVGKTTLLRLVRDSYTGKSGFDHIMFVGAGTGSVLNNVQHAIAINLGFDLAMMSSLDELSRATHIFKYLQYKSFLLLLDDIREPLNWWAVGVPILSHRRQKIIFATRSQAACALMGCHATNIIQMHCLQKEDAWSIFKDKVGIGIIDDHPQVHHIAKKMVAQCGGLPLALCTLGRAMSNKRDLREWRSACSQLTAISLEPCEIDDKISTIIADPPYRWRGDTILPIKPFLRKILPIKQIKAKTAVGQEDAELPAERI